MRKPHCFGHERVWPLCITGRTKAAGLARFRCIAEPDGGNRQHTQGGNAGLGIRETRGNLTMKKALIASTALILTAGVAAADVTISGYGRTGIIYQENTDAQDARGVNETQIVSRLRMNIDAATSSEQGVDFGARFRLQWDQNSSSRGSQGELNAGKLFVTSSGLTVEVGNVDTAFDTAGLLYASELGSYDRDLVRRGTFFAYDSDRYNNQLAQAIVDVNGDGIIDGNDVEELSTYNGIAARYSIAGATVRVSYIDPDQSGLIADDEELGFSVDYKWNDRLELSGAYVMDGGGVEDNDILFLGGRYAVMENARVGLNYIDASNDSDADVGDTFTLYGDYTLADGLTNIEAYVANNDDEDNESDNAYGIGVNYDLGGARLGASVQRGYDERVTADMGVRFDF
ncbi:porin [Paracoccus subflavus]|uniref:Porin n=2 Tax=Paracoccus subflavus TaxID=2528244 RepID=A0A4Q9G0B4_9RHOB|nr:porin [Paracoccus subflavus]